MSFYKFRIIILFIFTFISSSAFAVRFGSELKENTDQDTTSYVSPYAEENEKCFKCHGQAVYEYTNKTLDRTVRDLMCSDKIIKREDFYRSNHKSFSCTDCHSYDYTTFPHPGELRMEQMYTCLDCHAGDERFARYHFEEIDREYKESVHYIRLHKDGFSCWKCHNPHTYRVDVGKDNYREKIAYDNAICLNCHSNFNNFQLLTDRKEINIIQQHDWLPNQTAHFANVRCIECHTRVNDSIPVSHLILPKEQAVRLCNECHSQNSLLMASLYKFESKESRRNGFFNAIILNSSYVIGANRNEYLNLISQFIFLGVLAVIIIHIIFRILKKP
jgi:hypothetical protein